MEAGGGRAASIGERNREDIKKWRTDVSLGRGDCAGAISHLNKHRTSLRLEEMTKPDPAMPLDDDYIYILFAFIF